MAVNGVYPRLVADSARKAGVEKIIAAAFTDETDQVLDQQVDAIEWMRVGQVSRLLKFFREQNIDYAIMAGQIAPEKRFDLWHIWISVLVLEKLKTDNADTVC